MSGFTKLVPEIVMSSIWNESPEVRCVWITMLAIKDENGIVLGTEETLARIANVRPNGVTGGRLGKWDMRHFVSCQWLWRTRIEKSTKGR